MAANDQTSQDEVNDGADQKVTIGGVEMSVDEATKLIESGKSMEQLKVQYPEVDFNEMPKAFTQTRQKLAELEKAGANKKPEELDANETARKKTIDDFFEDPYVKEKLKSRDLEKEEQLKNDLALEKAIENLESEFDGSDGRPKFVRADVLKYGMENQIFNPRAAYREMHADALEDWGIKKRLDKRRPTTSFEKQGTGGAKQPEVKQASTFREATSNALASSDNDE